MFYLGNEELAAGALGGMAETEAQFAVGRGLRQRIELFVDANIVPRPHYDDAVRYGER